MPLSIRRAARLAPPLLALFFAAGSGCKSQDELQVQQAQDFAVELTNKGRAALADKRHADAVRLFTQAAQMHPAEPQGWLLVAEAQKQSGNEAAAVMALKQAEAVAGKADPAVRRQRADLYRQMGQTKDAIALFVELRDQNLLTDAETLELAHLQARIGDVEGAWASLESVQKRKPDDLEAKAVEAEILLLKGEEVLGARLLDRLVSDAPQLASARIGRARYFFANGLANEALQDLSEVSGEAAVNPELIALKARVLLSLKKNAEALEVLKPLSESKPKDADLSCLLAETYLALGRTEEAQALVDRALAAKPGFSRALYVRGRSKEAGGDLKGANADYQAAVKSDPGFAPALSRSWPLWLHLGEKFEAVSALEQLTLINEASPDEKLALVQLYVELDEKPTRAKALLEDAAKKKPGDPRLKELRARVAKMKTGKPKKSGIIIMRRGK